MTEVRLRLRYIRNPKLRGGVCHTLHADSRHYIVIPIEGNGARPSHQGIGYSEGGAMYTLNATEIHAVAYAVDHAITTGGGSTAQGSCVYKDIMATLKASGVHAVAYGLVTKGNGDAFITEEKHMSLSTGGGKQVRDTPPAYTLKIRGGVAVDSKGKSAGKGPLIQIEKSATLAVTQDQYLFQPIVFPASGGGVEHD